MTPEGKVGFAGRIEARPIAGPNRPLTLWAKVGRRLWGAQHFIRHGGVIFTSRLTARLIRADGSARDLGLLSQRVVTDAFVNYLVDELQASQAPFSTFKYHGSGTGTAAESASDTALGTPVESRATGTQAEGATANVYKSVGTVASTATRAITEHGLFSAATGPTLMDRSVFTAVNVVNGDSIEFTYQLTCTSGG